MKTSINTLTALGQKMAALASDPSIDSDFEALLNKVQLSNGWFTREQITTALLAWSKALHREKLMQWLAPYASTDQPKIVGLILAGNIPFVGLHDLLCIWVSGHQAKVKCATKDPYLLPWLVSLLETLSPADQGRIQFVDRLETYDAVIATGSNNSARYFEHYFAAVPHLIRRNRNAVAVLDGTETAEQYTALGDDILRYYGLGCRNVSKVFLPYDFDLDLIFGGLYPYQSVMKNQKYANNYDYNKAVFLMSEFDFLENGFFMLRECSDWAAPIACLHYEYYDSLERLSTLLLQNQEQIQCTISHLDVPTAIALGQAQEPELWQYADGVDTLAFLQQL